MSGSNRNRAMRDPYEVLGVERFASADDIRKAYRRRALETHPDRRSGEDTEFKEVQTAYDILSDPEKKEYYDRTGEVQDPEKSLAMGLLMDQFLSHMQHALVTGQDPGITDVLALVRTSLKQQLTDSKTKLLKLANAEAKLKKFLGRFRRKSGISEDNPFESLIKSELRHFAESKEGMQKSVKDIEEALRLADEYTYVLDPKTPAGDLRQALAAASAKFKDSLGKSYINGIWTVGTIPGWSGIVADDIEEIGSVEVIEEVEEQSSQVKKDSGNSPSKPKSRSSKKK